MLKNLLEGLTEIPKSYCIKISQEKWRTGQSSEVSEVDLTCPLLVESEHDTFLALVCDNKHGLLLFREAQPSPVFRVFTKPSLCRHD